MPVWIDWKGIIPKGCEAVRRQRGNRIKQFPPILHIRIIPQTSSYGRVIVADEGTLCGLEVIDVIDSEHWRSETELAAYRLPPFPDDLNACRICNARLRSHMGFNDGTD